MLEGKESRSNADSRRNTLAAEDEATMCGFAAWETNEEDLFLLLLPRPRGECGVGR
jgi:hypothetical protein